MKGWDKGGALTTCSNIASAEIGNDHYPRALSDPVWVAYLQRERIHRASGNVADRLAMAADCTDLAWPHAGCCKQFKDARPYFVAECHVDGSEVLEIDQAR